MPDDEPRLTPEEADARFAALVAEHRRETGRKSGRKRGAVRPHRSPIPATPRHASDHASDDASDHASDRASDHTPESTPVRARANPAMLLVYVIGVAAGSVWHAKLGTAVLSGVLVFVAYWGYAKFFRPADHR